MRKTKIVLLIAIVMATLMLFSSCFSSSVELKDILNSKNGMRELTIYTQNTLINDLTNAVFKDTVGDLVYFTIDVQEGVNTYEKHIIYNLESNNIIYTVTESASIDISLTMRHDYRGCSYFIVNTTSHALVNGIPTGEPTITTSLYDNAGAKVADAEGLVSVYTAIDIMYFDDKCYRMGEDGSITYAFDYPGMASFPSISDVSEDYYYFCKNENGNSYITVYDKDLNFVSKYFFPSYADVIACEILENGNIFAQYAYAEEENAEDYSFITVTSNSTVKYTLITEVINAKNGKAKEIKCDYALNSIYNYVNAEESITEEGIDFDKAFCTAVAFKIENKRLNQSSNSYRFVTINNRGKVSEFDMINGEHIQDISRFEENRWVVETLDDTTYLVNDDGDIIGNISNAEIFGKYINYNGKFYDCELNSVFDYEKNDLIRFNRLDDAVLFTNVKNEILLYTGESNTTTLIAEGSAREIVVIDNDYFVIKDSSSTDTIYEVYNGAGNKIMTVNGEYNLNVSASIGASFNSVASTDSAKLIRLVNDQNQPIYYRLSAN